MSCTQLVVLPKTPTDSKEKSGVVYPTAEQAQQYMLATTRSALAAMVFGKQ